MGQYWVRFKKRGTTVSFHVTLLVIGIMVVTGHAMSEVLKTGNVVGWVGSVVNAVGGMTQLLLAQS